MASNEGFDVYSEAYPGQLHIIKTILPATLKNMVNTSSKNQEYGKYIIKEPRKKSGDNRNKIKIIAMCA